MKIFVLVAAAVMALASCQKNEINGPVNKEVHFTIKADFAETKTAITDNGDKTYTPTWAKGDKIGVLFSLEGTAEKVEFENTADAGEIATFEGKHAFTVEEDATEVDGNLYAFYPSSAFNKMYDDGGVRLDLKATQYPTSTSFDPSCDLLIAKPCHYMAEATGEAAEVDIDDMYFARMMSVLKINLNSGFLSNETVKSVSFDADGVDFTGAMRFNLETGEFVGNQSTSQDLSEVKAVYSEEDPIAVAGEKNSAYLVVAPVTIPSGTALTFTIETENYAIVKTITAPADMVMPAGNIAVINLTIAEENCTAKVEDTSDYSGEWLIVNSDLTRAANAWANGNNLPEFELTTNEGVILESDGIANCKMIITKEADGYTIQDASGMYLYAAGGTENNHLKGKTEKSYWTIEKGETNYVITSLAQNTRNILRYNSSNKIFSCYSSGQADVTLYKYSEIKPDTNPRITLTKNSDKVAYDATSYDFTYTTKNITGNVDATIKEEATTMANVSASASNGTVTVNFDANADAEQKTATIVLSYNGAVSQEFVLTQAGKPAEGGESTVATWSWDGGGKSDFTGGNIYKTNGLGSDYAASHAPYQIKMDGTGDYFIIKVDGAIQSASVGVKMVGGASTSTLQVLGSSDGDSFTSVEELSISGRQNDILELVTTKQFDPSYRYLKFNFIKGSNIGVGPITITYIPENSEGGETPEQPTQTPRGLAFSPESATATIGQVFDAPTLSGVTDGVQYSSSNTAVATVNASTGAVTLVGSGTTTITATAPETEQYEAGTASYTLTVSAAPEGGEDSSETITVSNTIADIADANGWGNSTQYENINLDDVITATVSGGGNTGKYYTSGENWRIYQNESPSLTISASQGYTINSVKITYASEKTGVLTYNSSNVTSGTVVDVNASSITFGVGNTTNGVENGQVRVTAIEVVYQKN